VRSARELLQDILDAITRIERYTAWGRETFEQDELVQVWVLYHIQLIGEAAAQLGKAFHEAHPKVPWPQIVAMRNLLIHRYFGVDLEEVWKTVEKDLPGLKQKIETLVRKLGEPGCGE
jgi:uncharacterized protein with HEPN domain